MSHFCIDVADTIIEIETVHVLPFALSRQFLTKKAPDFKVISTQNDIDALKPIFQAENGLTVSWDGNIETMVVLRKVAEGLIDFGVFAMHGAVIAVDNNAYLFTADSGVGKTTHILKWLRNIPNSYVVNGDKPFIRIKDIPYACGSPWAGKENLYTNTKVPLKAIVIMERSFDNFINEISFVEAFPMLYKQIYRPRNAEKMKRTLSLLKAVGQKVTIYKFGFNNYKNDCLETAYSALIDS